MRAGSKSKSGQNVMDECNLLLTATKTLEAGRRIRLHFKKQNYRPAVIRLCASVKLLF